MVYKTTWVDAGIKTFMNIGIVIKYIWSVIKVKDGFMGDNSLEIVRIIV